MSSPFYITTPIYYVNDEPHLGHAYTTILADVLARYARLRGRETFFLTGTDEHGQKVQQVINKTGEDPRAYVDRMAPRFQAAWDRLDIAYDDFIRTTQERHVRVVQTVLQDLWQRGLIYPDEYEGSYCVADERFWTEKDLVNGLCPECGRPVETISEGNYFFRMSTYQDWLVDYIQTHPDFIQPPHRRNEVLGFLRQPLGDLCISRPASRLGWGIPLPFDSDFVTYVWFDALLNYITAAGYLSDTDRFQSLWPQAVHLIGKDILTTHSVYWPIMLKAMGLPLPKTIFAHGWWVTGGLKMSKSRGNVVKPLDLAEVYGVDAFRYFLMRDMTPGQDADFDEERIATRYQVDLANNLGNLLNRVVAMTGRYCGGILPAPGPDTEAEIELRTAVRAVPERVFKLVDEFRVNEALAVVFEGLDAVNGYLERTAPWKRAKTGETERVAASLYTAAEALRFLSILLQPVLPEKTTRLWQQLGWQPPEGLKDGLVWGVIQPGTAVQPGEALFPREPLLVESK